MNQTIFDSAYQIERFKIGNALMTNNVKTILYKLDNELFDKIDFYDDTIYQEPLLFAYINSSEKNSYALDWFLYGYMEDKFKPIKFEVFSDEYGRIYFPNWGWLIVDTPHQKFTFESQNGVAKLLLNNDNINYVFEPLDKILDGDIELIKYPIPILKQCFYDIETNAVEVEVEVISKQQRKNQILAWNIVKEVLPQHYDLIVLASKKMLTFNVDTYLRNSFASITAQGVGFFNAYQEDYDEVFFLDDIMHQTGHVIFNNIIFNKESFFLKAPSTIIQNVENILNDEHEIIETRDAEVLLHALYTYYTTFLIIDACLEKNIFSGKKKHELVGRMAFYLRKCYYDLCLFEVPSYDYNKTKHLYKPEDIFAKDGLFIYNGIKKTYNIMIEKWGKQVQGLKLSNQPYNFTYSKFIELNPIIYNHKPVVI